MLILNAMRTFIRENWYSITATLTAIVVGVYTLGVQAQKYDALTDRVGEIKSTQTNKIKEFDDVKQDINLLKWSTDTQKDNIDQIKLDVRSIDKRTQEIEKRMEVVIELLKPRAAN